MTKKNKLDKLAKAASIHWKVPLHRLRSKDRCRKLVWPRSVCMYLACRAGMSRQEIGDWWGKDQSTVTHGKQSVDDSIELYPDKYRQVEAFVAFLAGFLDKVD